MNSDSVCIYLANIIHFFNVCASKALCGWWLVLMLFCGFFVDLGLGDFFKFIFKVTSACCEKLFF